MIKKWFNLLMMSLFFVLAFGLLCGSILNLAPTVIPEAKNLVLPQKPYTPLDQGLANFMAVERCEANLFFEGQIVDLGAELEKNFFIKSSLLFDAMAIFYDLPGRIAPGFYHFEKGASTLDIVRQLSDNRQARFVVINPGETISEWGSKMQRSGITNQMSLAVKSDKWLKQLQKKYGPNVGMTSLDGFIYPGFYAFNVEDFNSDLFVEEATTRFDRKIGSFFSQDLSRMPNLLPLLAKNAANLRRDYYKNIGSDSANGSVSARSFFGGAF
jgi:hypothetical protein